MENKRESWDPEAKNTKNISHLLKANILSVFMETLTADIESVFSDDSMAIRAGTAIKKNKLKIKKIILRLGKLFN